MQRFRYAKFTFSRNLPEFRNSEDENRSQYRNPGLSLERESRPSERNVIITLPVSSIYPRWHEFPLHYSRIPSVVEGKGERGGRGNERGRERER